MKKIVVLGAKKDRSIILQKLQDLGAVHVVSANINQVKSQLGDMEEIEQTDKAISILKDGNKNSSDAEKELPEDIVDTVLVLHNTKQKLLNAKAEISQRLENISVWGEFSTEQWNALQEHGIYIQFCKTTTKTISDVDQESIVYKKQNGKDLFIALLSRDKKMNLPQSATEIKIKKGSVELKREKLQIEEQLSNTESKIEELKAHLFALEKHALCLRDKACFKVVENQLFYQDDVFALEGYIPATAEMEDSIQKIPAAVALSEVTDEDAPPTLIQNPKWVQSVVDLVKLYAIPGYKEWDTSAVLYLAFTVFFAMIVGDAGYGCILLGLMLLLKGKLKGNEGGKRFFHLMVTLSVACIVFGAMGGNWFAIQLADDNPLKQFQVMNLSENQEENLNNMMMLSVYVGAAHLSLARVIQIIRVFPSTLLINQIGWLIMMWGAIAKILWNKDYGLTMLLGGAILAVLFATTHRNIFKRLALGLLDLLGLTQNFADILSYLRLFALGLASTVMASIFNDLGTQVKDVSSTFGPILMVLVIFLGHTINLVLAIMGGFIHGLRLNFLEFYRYCFEGTGYDYEPFAKKA